MQASQSFHGGPSVSVYCNVELTFSAQPSKTQSSSASTKAEGTNTETAPETTSELTVVKCNLLPDECNFHGYSILLSPCIADFPWVTEDHLSCHGVTQFLRDPKEWLNDQPSASVQISSSTSTSASRPSTGSTPRRTKIVLVDARRREATTAFLQSIEAAQLKRSNGEREYVPVYDWRALEEIKKEEQKCGRNGQRAGRKLDLSSSHSVWRPFWVGLV